MMLRKIALSKAQVEKIAAMLRNTAVIGFGIGLFQQDAGSVGTCFTALTLAALGVYFSE